MCHTVFARGFATTSVATHLTLNHGFPIIRLSQPGGCIDPKGSLAERQRRSPRGCSTATGNRTLDPTNGARRSQDRTAFFTYYLLGVIISRAHRTVPTTLQNSHTNLLLRSNKSTKQVGKHINQILFSYFNQSETLQEVI